MMGLRYLLSRWFWKRQITLCHYKREELDAIYRRELAAIEYDEGKTNARLRELQSRMLNERIGEVRA